MPSRRTVLAGAGSLVAGALATGRVLADHPDEQPTHVSIDYPTSIMDRYRPALDLSAVDPGDILGLYGWRATSPEYELDYLVWWVRWSHQEGVTSFDSHYLDHEPVLVGLDKRSGAVEYLAYSAYHWLKAEAVKASIPLQDDTHPVLYVFSPWHHYRLAPDAVGAASLREAASLQGELESWRQNGLEEDLVPGACYDPASMRARSDWWREDLGGLSTEALRANAYLAVGLDDADAADVSSDLSPLQAARVLRWLDDAAPLATAPGVAR